MRWRIVIHLHRLYSLPLKSKRTPDTLTRPFRLTKTESRILLVALAVATLVKLYFAFFTVGSVDALAFQDHLEKIRSFGVGAYNVRGRFNNPFNSPPPMIYVIRFWGWLADMSGFPFGFWLRLPSILADIGAVLVLARWLPRSWPDRTHLPVLLAMTLCPASLLISGYHGTTDPTMIFFVLLSLYLLELSAPAWIAGIFFGLAVCIKVVPLGLAPVLFLYISGGRQRAGFFGAAAVTFGVFSMPFLLQDPKAIWSSVFGYGSIYGDWGWTLLAQLLQPVEYLRGRFEPLGIHATIARGLKIVTILSLIIAAIWMNWRRRPSLLLQVGFAFSIILFMAPGFGVQYLAWLIPFVVALGLWPSLVYYLASGLLLAWVYFSVKYSASIVLSVYVLGWLSVLVVGLEFRRKIPLHGESGRDLV